MSLRKAVPAVQFVRQQVRKSYRGVQKNRKLGFYTKAAVTITHLP